MTRRVKDEKRNNEKKRTGSCNTTKGSRTPNARSQKSSGEKATITFGTAELVRRRQGKIDARGAGWWRTYKEIRKK